MTTGETIVRTDFNASKSDDVAIVKNEIAGVINKLESEIELARTRLLDSTTEEEYNALNKDLTRVYDKAVLVLEEASMWATKALTSKLVLKANE